MQRQPHRAAARDDRSPAEATTRAWLVAFLSLNTRDQGTDFGFQTTLVKKPSCLIRSSCGLLKKIPLRRYNAGVDGVDHLLEDRAYHYERGRDGSIAPVARYRRLYPFQAATGLYSTASELTKWARAVFYDTSFLTQESRLALFSLAPNTPGYALGLHNQERELVTTLPLIWHDGLIAGTHTMIGFLPSCRSFFVLLSNLGFSHDLNGLAWKVAETVLRSATGDP